jgi:hypothetical protein
LASPNILIARGHFVLPIGGVLTFVLGAVLLASIFLTGTVVAIFVTFRLVQHLASRGDLKQGVVGWAHETRIRFRWPAPESSGSVVVNHDQVKKEPSATSGLEGWHSVGNVPGEQR